MYFLGDMHIVPSSSLTKSQPRWKLIGTHTLELKLILGLQQISDNLGVLGSSSDIIHIDSYVLVDIAILSHPDIWLGLTWRESHVSEAISKTLMPMKAGGP